jgi:hypothetical protein
MPYARALGALLALVAGAWYLTVVRSRSARTDRTWVLAQSRAPRTEFRGDTLIIHDVRRFRYPRADTAVARWTTDTLLLSRLQEVRFALSPFGPTWTGAGHAFVTFAFSDSQALALSVEARREQGETYGFLAGLTRQFEVIYVAGDEPDIIGRRVVDGEDVYLFPVNSPPNRTREMLVSMLTRANTLRTTPVLYNTLVNNCTSTLVDHVNAIIPGRVPSGWQTLLPGYADRVAQRIGLLADSGDPLALRMRYRVNGIVAELPDDPSFSTRLRAALQSPSAQPAAR